MPSKSRSQQRLFQAAAGGADFPAAKKLRASMTKEQLSDFASGSMAGKPEHAPRHRMTGSHDGMFVTEHHRKAKQR